MARRLVILTLAAAAAVPAAGAAATPWRPPVALSSRAGPLTPGPQVAVARNGAVAVTWLQAVGELGLTNTVEVARRAQPAGSFQPPLELDRLAGLTQGPVVSLAADGSGTAAWVRERRPWITRVPPSGPATAVATVPGAGIAEDLSVGVDRTGAAILLFTERDFPATSPLRTVEVAERPAGSVAVSAPLVLSAPGSTEPALAVAPDGRAVAAWIGPDHAVWAASRDPATAWQPAVRVSGPGPARGVAVAIGELGDAAVSWFERAPMVALRARDGSWSPPEAVAPAAPLPPGAPTALAIAPLGDAVAVAWRESPAPLTLKVAWRANPARPWRASPIARATGRRNVGPPRLVMARSGDALVLWTHPLTGGSQIRARRVPRGGPLGPVERVSTGSGPRLFPSVAIGTGGTITAAWVARQPSSPHATLRFVASTRRAILP
jgi:hypothetical protein